MSAIVLPTFNWDSVRTSLNCKENTPDTLQNELSQQNDLNISIAGFGPPPSFDRSIQNSYPYRRRRIVLEGIFLRMNFSGR